MVSHSLPSTKQSLCLKAHLFAPEIMYNLSDRKIKQSKTKQESLNKYLWSTQYFAEVVLDVR